MDTQNPIFELLNELIIIPLETNEVFRTGFCWGISLALLIGLLIGTFSRFTLYFLTPITSFFKPSSKPATNPGPSPFNQLMGCLKQFILLFILIVIIIIVITVLTRNP